MVKDANCIALVGFMGTGKTTVGRRLAEVLHRPFVDLDEYIAQRAGRSIPEIFASTGESGFRSLETEALETLIADGRSLILSTGGGIVTMLRNRKLLHENFSTILLEASVETILGRIEQDESRPLLGDKEGRLNRIRGLLDERMEFYRDVSDFDVDVNGLDVEQVAGIILKFLRIEQ